jgi:PhoPQ-activated pathogenicity-related protein
VGLAVRRGWTTFFTDAWDEENETVYELRDRLKIDARIEWAKTSHGGRQQDFVRTQEPAACSSVYGLCE